MDLIDSLRPNSNLNSNTNKRKSADSDFISRPTDKKPKINTENDSIDNLIYILKKSTISDNQTLLETIRQLTASLDDIKANEINLEKKLSKLKDKNSQYEFTVTLLNKKYAELEIEIINLKDQMHMIMSTSPINNPVIINSPENWNSYIN